MMLWVHGAIILALMALGAEMFARYRKMAVELEQARRASRAKAEKHAEASASLRAEIPQIEAQIATLSGERASLAKDLNWERENLEELNRRKELRLTGRQQVKREGQG